MEIKICGVVLKDKKLKNAEEFDVENAHLPHQIMMKITPEETAHIIDRECK